ncbi:MAG: HAD family hydrolase [Clostridiales bacterium]|nr:HAD family hydrolase [Clostridiales bacterium]
MKIRAVVFDIGQTLAFYRSPKWAAYYRTAFESSTSALGLSVTEEEYDHVVSVLSKYNTRTNPREYEVSSDTIFREILEGTSIGLEHLSDIRSGFYSYFRNDSYVYPEADQTLSGLKRRGIPLATLSDVPYGMDNVFALEDIKPLLQYIDLPYTSNDTGYRKPCGNGLLLIAGKLDVPVEETAFVGDEDKDILCARNAGAVSILINRTEEARDYGQDMTITALTELLDIV